MVVVCAVEPKRKHQGMATTNCYSFVTKQRAHCMSTLGQSDRILHVWRTKPLLGGSTYWYTRIIAVYQYLTTYSTCQRWLMLGVPFFSTGLLPYSLNLQISHHLSLSSFRCFVLNNWFETPVAICWTRSYHLSFHFISACSAHLWTCCEFIDSIIFSLGERRFFIPVAPLAISGRWSFKLLFLLPYLSL